MEQMKQSFRDMPLRRTFSLCVFTAIAAAVLLSVLTVWGCSAFRSWLLPEKDKVYLSVNKTYSDGTVETAELLLQVGQELPMLGVDGNVAENANAEVSYTLSKAEQSYRALTPKRQAAFLAAGGAMIVMPMLYCILGILICAFWFYRHKLQGPLLVLENATEQIAKRDLDFSVTTDSGDEMGRLCKSFEMMRQGLYQANKEVWLMLEQRQKFLSSVSHDLRNPIAIIKGYTEYLQINIPKGTMKPEQLSMIADNLAFGAARLERYADSVSSINQLEAIKLQYTTCYLQSFLLALAEDMKILSEKKHMELTVQHTVPELEVSIDRENYARILENIFQNALRFTKKKIQLKWEFNNDILHTTIMDDGPGFSDTMLKKQEQLSVFGEAAKEHMGMGLVVSKILCVKHGGRLQISNSPSAGAKVHFTINIY